MARLAGSRRGGAWRPPECVKLGHASLQPSAFSVLIAGDNTPPPIPLLHEEERCEEVAAANRALPVVPGQAIHLNHGAKVASAILRITVDNGYSLFLDGREIGRGSDWRTVTEYNVTRLLNPGRHNIGVEGFNDRLEAGLIFGLNVQLVDQRTVEVVSDGSWLVVPDAKRNWAARKNPLPEWHPAVVVGAIHHHPWEIWPFGLTTEPALLRSE